MATAFTHGFVAAALKPLLPEQHRHWKMVCLLIFLSIMPDFDVLAFKLGIPYQHPLGHRGFTHSLLFALICGILIASLLESRKQWFKAAWWRLLIVVFLVVISHGLLDALTNGGRGVGFYIPFDNNRYFFDCCRVIRVSPIGVQAFFSSRAWGILSSEIIYVWLPIIGLFLLIMLGQRFRRLINN